MGIIGNEAADKAAKEAARHSPDHCCKIPFTDLRGKYKIKSKENTNNIIINHSKFKGNKFFTYYHDSKATPWFFNKHLPREIITSINRSRSGHYSLAASLAKCNIIDNPYCNCTNNMYFQDIDHVLWQCALYDKERQNFLSELRRLGYCLPLVSSMLLCNPTSKLCKTVYKFLKACNLKI